MIITLRRAEATHFEGVGVRGFVSVETDDGGSRLYAFRLPTREEPNPPGWAQLAKLARVETERVIESWNESQSNNPVAEQALIEISTLYAGEKFLLTEIPDPKGTGPAAELVLLDVRVAAPKKMTSLTPLPPPPAVYVDWSRVNVLKGEPGDPAYLFIEIDALDSSLWPRFRVPDATDRSPPDWWFVETFTGIAHERIAFGWTRQGNPPLDDTVLILAQALSGHRVPLTPEGRVNLERFRREVVRARLAQGHKPFVFLTRPDHTFEHTKAILTDAVGPFLFKTGYEEKKSQGRAVMITNVGGAMLMPLDRESVMRTVLNNYIRFATSGRPPKPKQPPKELLESMMDFPDASWPPIKGIVRIPTMRADGTILAKAGYDESSQLWFAPEFELDPIPEYPTRDDVARARALLVTPLAEFPFVNEAGAQAGTIACLLEQIVRPMIDGPRPLYIFEAPPEGQGTGKTLLALTLQAIITGQKPYTSSPGKREEEIEKRITSLLREQNVFVVLDNLEGVINSPALAQLATSTRWQARLLNTNEAPILEQAVTWALTLNHAQVNRDLARRIILIRLDAKVPDPNKRKGFRIENVIRWVLDRRPALIRACLILARSWHNAGRPKDPELALGSFEGWCMTVGGILHHAGFLGLSKAIEASAERDTNVEDHRFLVRLWLQTSPDMALPAIKLGQLAEANGLYEGKLLKKGAPIAQGKRMANILRGVLGRVIEGHRIELHPTRQNGYSLYTLRPVN